MTQNRNKIIELFIGNLSNSIVHKVLEKAIDNPDISKNYFKEVKNSWDIAKQYREKINPANAHISNKDSEYIKNKVISKTNAELKKRISRGYKNINLSLVEQFTENSLKELKCL